MQHALTATELATAAARKYFRGRLGVEFKADESPVTQADRGVETVVRDYLSAQFPDHGIFGEEHGIERGERDDLWIVDPIDGTRSFLSGHPMFGFLLGHLHKGVPDLGVIAMPALGEVLIGRKGGGAHMNGEQVRASDQTDLSKAILFVNEGDKIHKDRPAVFGRLMQAGQTRRFAYDCYPHALVAMGHVDAVVDYDLQPYDYLPVSAVVEAAGGVMSDWQGRALTISSGTQAAISAATPQLHAQLLDLVNG
nr:inositol monophosphatase family protein [Shimia abyssi]